MTAVKQWSGEAIEAAAAAQGIALAPGRAERLARGQQQLLDASAADASRGSLALEAEPSGFLLAIERCKAA